MHTKKNHIGYARSSSKSSVSICEIDFHQCLMRKCLKWDLKNASNSSISYDAQFKGDNINIT